MLEQDGGYKFIKQTQSEFIEEEFLIDGSDSNLK